jgi:hypothetical protein
MATLSDWQTRTSRLQDDIVQLENLIESSDRNSRGTRELIRSVNDLEKTKAALETKQKDFEQTAATFDREFLERKSEYSDPFKPDKLYTIQDFVFFFFFVSYCIFVLALSLTMPSDQGKILIGGFVLLLVSFALIMRYA